jgi:hypothetical protein
MTRYFFDIRADDETVTDDEGFELVDMKDAKIEAAQSLADMAKAAGPRSAGQTLTISVRTADGPAFKASLVYEPTGR